MTLLDIIELYNLNHGKELGDITSIYENADIDTRLDRTTLAGVLLDECGALQALYNVSDTFVTFSNLFFKKYKWNIEKLIDTMEFEYDPLKNRRLDWTETTDIDQNLVTDETTSENRTKDNTGTQTTRYIEDVDETHAETTDREYNDSKSGSKSESDEYDSTETNTISAMNSSNYEPDTKRVTDTDDSKSTTTSESGSGTSTDELQGSDTRDTDSTKTRTDALSEEINASNDRDKNEDLTWDETDTHTESGTVNVTYQELIEKERKIAQFSIYGWIAKKYAKELFLLVY